MTEQQIKDNAEIVQLLENRLKYDTIAIHKYSDTYFINKVDNYGELEERIGQGKTLLEALQSIGKEVKL